MRNRMERFRPLHLLPNPSSFVEIVSLCIPLSVIFSLAPSLLLVDVERALVLEEARLVVPWQRRISEVDVLHTETHTKPTSPL